MDKINIGYSFLDNFFKEGIITEIIGSNYSCKYYFIALYLLKKMIYTKSKVLYIDTQLSCPVSFLHNAFEKILEKNKNSQIELENSFMILRIDDSKQLFLFVEYYLLNLIKSTSNIKTIVLNNINNLFVPEKIKGKKGGKYYMRIFWRIAKEYKINIIYINDIYFRNNAFKEFNSENKNYSEEKETNYVMEIEYSEYINEYCSNVILINDNYNYHDNYLECKCEVLKGIQSIKQFTLQIDTEKCSFKSTKED